MAELEDAPDLGSGSFGSESASLSGATIMADNAKIRAIRLQNENYKVRVLGRPPYGGCWAQGGLQNRPCRVRSSDAVPYLRLSSNSKAPSFQVGNEGAIPSSRSMGMLVVWEHRPVVARSLLLGGSIPYILTILEG